jgi:hypothetical protein
MIMLWVQRFVHGTQVSWLQCKRQTSFILNTNWPLWYKKGLAGEWCLSISKWDTQENQKCKELFIAPFFRTGLMDEGNLASANVMAKAGIPALILSPL